MSRFGGWKCDGCGLEDRGGMPGQPPDRWVRVEARTAGYLTADADYCPTCARNVDTYAVAVTAARPVQPTPPKPKGKRAPKRPALELEDESDDDR